MTLRRMMAFTCLLSVSLILSACGDATATDKSVNDLTAKSVTSSDCLVLKIKEDKIACFKELKVQEKASLEATNKRIEALAKENEKLDQENEALIKEFERGVLDEE